MPHWLKHKTAAPPRGKIEDPVQDAEQTGPGIYVPVETIDQWGRWAARCATTSHFMQVEGIRYYNNCGPTALTNLICMCRERERGAPPELEEAKSVYHRIARYGIRHLYFINSASRWFHGTSDLRAASYIRRMCKRMLGWKPRVRLRRITWANIHRSLERGSVVYLMLWNHPAYRSHHLLAYGCQTLRNEDTGAQRVYLKVCDGHNSAARYVDLEDARGLYCEVIIPDTANNPS